MVSLDRRKSLRCRHKDENQTTATEIQIPGLQYSDTDSAELKSDDTDIIKTSWASQSFPAA